MRLVTLNNDDPREILEIARIQNNDDMLSVIAMIRRAYNKARDQCVDTDGVGLYRSQGSAKALKEVLDAFDNARDIAGSPDFRLR